MEPDEDIRSRLNSILYEHLTLVENGESIPIEAELSQLGLDSMNAVNLLIDLEGAFSITFPDSMLNAETFRSVATLEKAIETIVRG